MTYQWKIPGLMPVDAQDAGEELQRIYDTRGAIAPADIVDESRPVAAPLHPCFEWNDSIAAEKYREVQAGGIVRAITTVTEEPVSENQAEVRAFVRMEDGYEPIAAVVQKQDKMDYLLATAMSELKAFQGKYAMLSSLRPIFREIDRLGGA